MDETRISGKHILLAEDNDLNAEIAEFILEDMGLDVYKRQVAYKSELLNQRMFSVVHPGEVQEFLHIVTDIFPPVSYTHLDVYKRQL